MKKATAVKESSTTAEPAKKKDDFVIRVPRLSFKDRSLNIYLVFTIVIFAFILGMLTNKVLYLEKQVKDGSANTASAANPQAAGPSVEPTPAGPVDIGIGNYSVRGNESAKVTVIEFADFRCPFCEKWFTDTETNLMKDYVDTGKVKFAYRNYAFLGEASTLAANAGECANEQSKFWDFHDYMFQHQPDESDTSMFTVDNLSQIAGTLGMDQSQFSSCLTDKKYDKNVAKDLSDGQSVGVQGTPTVFVNGIAVVGAVPYSELKKEIDKALAAK